MPNINEKPNTPEDRLMTPVEHMIMPIEREEERILRAIEVSKKIGFPVQGIAGKWQELEVHRRTLLWLDSFTDVDEKAEALERIAQEGLPPEVFKDDKNFLIEGNNTVN